MFNVSTGRCRLPFNRIENRPFHLALFRQMFFVSRKGCWVTTLEMCKLLISLAPLDDPLGCFLTLDFFAIKAGQTRWLQSVWKTWKSHSHFKSLPNIAYSNALVEWMNEEEEMKKDRSASSALLEVAIIQFPNVVPLLLAKCGAPSVEVTANPFFQNTNDDE